MRRWQHLPRKRRGDKPKLSKNIGLLGESGAIPGLTPPASGGGGGGGTSSSKGGGGSSSGIRNVTIHIGKLVESLNVQTTNLSGDASEVKALITETLLAAVNDANLAIQ